MKLILTIFLSFYIVSIFGQTQKTIEYDLIRQFKKITYWRDYKVDDEKVNWSDSLEKENFKFQEILLKYTSQNLSTIHFEFKNLIELGLTISTSEDKLFRIYSWDTWTGGSMQFYQTVIQYKVGNNVFSKVIKDPINGSDIYGGSWYLQIFTIHTSKKTFYLGYFENTFSNKDHYQGVKSFTIENHSLNDTCKFIKTNSGLKNKLGFGFNFFSVVNRKERPVKLITYNSIEKTLMIPVVFDDGQVSNRTIVYQLKGDQLERRR